ncbi:MAG: hypothetical protein AB7O97_06130 [Planctomycetota bacterium]
MLAVAPAQAPSAWSSIAPPGGVVPGFIGPASSGADRKVMVYRDGAYLQAFSAVTGRWHAASPSAAATVSTGNDLVLIADGAQWTAFSAWTGRFAPLTVGAAFAPMQLDDSVAYVRDGGTVHGFSAFTGDWHAHAIPAGWAVRLAERTLVFYDPAGAFDGASAFDPYTGTWHDLAARPEALDLLAASGGTALARFASAQFGFSSQHSAWIALPATAGTVVPIVVGQPGSDLLAVRGTMFSGITGTALVHPSAAAPLPLMDVDGLVGSATASGFPSFVCGPRAMTWVPVPAPAPSLFGNSAWVMAANAGSLHVFSAITNAFAPPVAAPTWAGTNAVVAALPPSGLIELYSALTGQWYAPPTGAVSVPSLLDAEIGAACALLRTATGVSAFSARTGARVPLSTGFVTFEGGGGAAVAAVEGNVIHVFDPQKDRWLQTSLTIGIFDAPRFAGAPFGSTAVFKGAEGVVAFGARNGRLELLPQAQPVLGRDAVGHFAWASSATELHGFTGFPDIAPWFGVPGDWFGCGVGGVMRFQVRLPQGSAALVGIGPRLTAPVALPPGELWLDPAFAEIRFVLPDPGEDRAVQALPIPSLPVFHGTEWFLQAFVAPAAGAPYLSDPMTMRIL